MRDLEYVNRWTPSFEGRLDEVIDRIKFTPYTDNSAYGQAGWLHLNTRPLLRNDRGLFHVRITEELVRMMQKRSIFAPEWETAYEDHSLDLNSGDHGLCLGLSFSKISGYYSLMKLDMEELRDLLDEARYVGGIALSLKGGAEPCTKTNV